MSVDIRIDGWALTSDSRQWITAREVVIDDEESDNYGETRLRDRKYHTTLEQALKRLADRRLADSDASSLRELVENHRRLWEEIEQAVSEAEEVSA